MKKKQVFNSAKQASAQLGIPYNHFKIARDLGCKGVRYGKYDRDLFLKWYETHKPEIESILATNKDTLGSYKLIREIIEMDLDIARKRKEMLDPREVYSLLERIGNAQRDLLSAFFKRDYSARMVGKSETETSIVLEEMINDLLTEIRTKLPSFIH